MELTVTYLGNVQFEAEARGHKVVCDQPLEAKGDNEGMTPSELLLASLATCVGYYAVYYLKTRNLSAEGLLVTVEAENAPNPARLGRFRIAIDVPGLDDPRHVEGVKRAAEKCLIKNTMLHPPSFEIDVHATAAALS